ncbi:hypothetical protein F4X86_00420 [Candidatus Saccharibacteria bacterium]|nr:hypothetical protein [Candidatus Saccharibacteria bacterium]
MRRLAGFGLTAVICGLLLAGWPPAGVEAVDGGTVTEEVKMAAIRRLEVLAASQTANPDASSAAEVSAGCEAFTAVQVAGALKSAEDSRKEYGRLASTAVVSLDFVINNLRQTAQDVSAVVAIRDELVGLETDFAGAAWSYVASLQDLTALGGACADRPALFIAGLRQARLQRLEAVHYAEVVLRFVETDFANVLAEVREQSAEEVE